MSFPAVNLPNGDYYIKQDASKDPGLDPFAAIGLHANSDGLTQRGAKLHAKKALLHVYERQDLVTEGREHVSMAACGRTHGPRVPLWVHVNKAKDLLAAGKEADFQTLRATWIARGSRQTWNSFAEAGSEEAKKPRVSREIPAEYTKLDPSDAPAKSETTTSKATTTASSGPKTTTAEATTTARSEPKPAPPHSEPKPAPPPSTARSTRPSPPFIDMSDPAYARGQWINGAWVYGPNLTNRTESVRSAREPVARSPFSNDPLATPHRRVPRFDPTASNRSLNPSSASKRRVVPRGVYLGNWNKSGLPANQSNAVYGSRDSQGRFNRRISLEHRDGHRVDGGNFSTRHTACKHEDIDHIGEFRGMTKAQVEAAVSPQLEAALGSMDSATPSSASRRRRRVDREESPTPVRYGRETAGRRGAPIELDSEDETASKSQGESADEEWENYADFF